MILFSGSGSVVCKEDTIRVQGTCMCHSAHIHTSIKCPRIVNTLGYWQLATGKCCTNTRNGYNKCRPSNGPAPSGCIRLGSTWYNGISTAFLQECMRVQVLWRRMIGNKGLDETNTSQLAVKDTIDGTFVEVNALPVGMKCKDFETLLTYR
jgi:hypothetical protein